MIIFCVTCHKEVKTLKASGLDIYPHRKDLEYKVFYRCGTCSNYVGCHPGTSKPLGVIPSQELRRARRKIHSVLDPLWNSGKIKRKHLYSRLSSSLGYTYHTGEIRSLEEAREIYIKVAEIHNSLL